MDSADNEALWEQHAGWWQREFSAGADLKNVSFFRTNLVGAKLTSADLTGAQMTEAMLRGANLAGALLGSASRYIVRSASPPVCRCRVGVSWLASAWACPTSVIGRVPERTS